MNSRKCREQQFSVLRDIEKLSEDVGGERVFLRNGAEVSWHQKEKVLNPGAPEGKAT